MLVHRCTPTNTITTNITYTLVYIIIMIIITWHTKHHITHRYLFWCVGVYRCLPTSGVPVLWCGDGVLPPLMCDVMGGSITSPPTPTSPGRNEHDSYTFSNTQPMSVLNCSAPHATYTDGQCTWCWMCCIVLCMVLCSAVCVVWYNEWVEHTQIQLGGHVLHSMCVVLHVCCILPPKTASHELHIP